MSESDFIQAIERESCRRSLWEFNQYLNPDFFKYPHLKIIADKLQALYEGKLLKPSGKPYKKLMMNLPPRHGKTFSLIEFSMWILGQNIKNKLITVSYNELLSSRYSKGVRDGIEATKFEEDKHIFSDIFPNTKIKKGDAASGIWALEGNYINYLGTSFKGTIGGIGADIGIIDDPIRGKEEAYNERVLLEHIDFYKNTFTQRLEEGAIQIVNMTRWMKNDLCGWLLANYPDDWYIIKMEAMTDGVLLCPEILSMETYLDKQKTTDEEIFQANYHQEPMDIKGRLYKSFKTYAKLPVDEEGKSFIEGIYSYTDTADEGSDFLCSIIYGTYNKEVYILDVYYTNKGMEITEPETAKRHIDLKVNKALIESNSGGRGFARAVERIMQEKNNKTVVRWFHQSANKKSRILSNSHWIQEHVYFPVNWSDKFPEFYLEIIKYQKEGKNKHDDAADCLTGVAEQQNTKSSRYIFI